VVYYASARHASCGTLCGHCRGQARGSGKCARDEATRTPRSGSGRRNALHLKEVMTPGVEVITPKASIYEAAEKMRHLGIGPLPVCEGESLVGMVTDRDITVRAVAEGRDPMTTPVREVMTPDAIDAFDDHDVEEAARVMEQYQIRRLPVVNRRKQLVGIVVLGDLAVHLGNQPVAAEVLEQVSEPGKSGRK
jgi:CBS domain-containing protein